MSANPSPAWLEAHKNDDRAPGIIVCGTICLAVSLMVVVIRVVSRRIVRATLELDDFIILIAITLMIVFSTFLFLTTRYGMGKHIYFISSAKWLTISITAAEGFYVLTIMAIKCSILMFYRRVFPQKWFHNLVWVMFAIVVAYNLSCFFATIMQCMPVAHQWDPTKPAYCIDYFAVVVYSGVLNVVTDFIILGMPIPLIRNLQVSKSKRRELMIVFSWGMAACVVSIARTVKASALTSIDSSWDLAGALYATTLELCIGIISSCVPILRPAVSRIWTTFSGSNVFSSRTGSTKTYGLPTYEKSLDSIQHPLSHRTGERCCSGEVYILRDYSVTVE